MKSFLVSEFSNFFDGELAQELVGEYVKVKEAEIQGKDDYIGQRAGHFFEVVLKVCGNIKMGTKPTMKGINFEKEYAKLIKLQKDTVEDEIICLVIPNIAKGGYTLRNKKRISHARGIDPTYIDSRIIIESVDWIIAELLRLYHTKDDEKIQEILKSIVERKVPLLEMIDGEEVFLDKDMKTPTAVLLFVYKNDGKVAKKNLETALLKYYPLPNIQTAVSRARRDRTLYLGQDDVLHLTQKGFQEIEKRLKKEFTR